MPKFLKQLKLDFFYLRRAFFGYKKGFKYLYCRYFLAKKILKVDKIFEKTLTHQNLSIHILTCHRDLVMTIWALASFYQVFNIIGELYVHNDGSLKRHDKEIIKKFFPSVRLINAATFPVEFSGQLDNYPTLKRFRTQYANFFSFKKIIDPYLMSDKKIHLIIDSDILWFKEPLELENEIKSGCQHSLMQKNNSSITANFKNGTQLAEELSYFNAGIILYSKENFDLERLTDFLTKIDENDRHDLHFADQAGHAYALKNLRTLASDKYIIREMVSEITVAKHYTSPRRPLFYLEGLKKLKGKIL